MISRLETRPHQRWGTSNSHFSVYRGFSRGENRPERGVYRLPPSSAEVEVEWSYASAPPLCLHDMYGKTFPFFFRSHLSSFILPILPPHNSFRGTEILLNSLYQTVEGIPSCKPDNHILIVTAISLMKPATPRLSFVIILSSRLFLS